jgi:carboxypeptidase T
MNDSYCKNNKISQGVDLNRNYDFHFGGSSEDKEMCGETFNGGKPFSEPET